VFFEEQPWLLIPLIIVVVEAWSLVKAQVRRRVEARRESVPARDRSA
jgi:hypothetical protein